MCCAPLVLCRHYQQAARCVIVVAVGAVVVVVADSFLTPGWTLLATPKLNGRDRLTRVRWVAVIIVCAKRRGWPWLAGYECET